MNETKSANGYTIVELLARKTLVGITSETEFPGFHSKAQWLEQSFSRLAAKLPSIDLESETVYFIYHGVEHGPMVCVEWKPGTAVPDGLMTVTLEPQRFAVFMHKGPIDNQERTFIDICDTDFMLNESGVHFELHNLKALREAASDRFELPIYMPAVKPESIR
ncbi:hypothetical protein [Paenibacillus thermotolerans]|uniref:hypothetical protein n=1 Tax=Paenibacillus thermotolerans TaxID=3027807 RepID=UPI0023678560|nr:MULTISPECIES: hypothetical protein [unclassified Paenibacillus]